MESAEESKVQPKEPPRPVEEIPPTIQSILQEFASHDAFSDLQPLHPYSSNPEATINMLRSLINSTTDVASSLNAQVTLPFSNPKFLSLCREQSSISYTVHNVSTLGPLLFIH